MQDIGLDSRFFPLLLVQYLILLCPGPWLSSKTFPVFAQWEIIFICYLFELFTAQFHEFDGYKFLLVEKLLLKAIHFVTKLYSPELHKCYFLQIYKQVSS